MIAHLTRQHFGQMVGSALTRIVGEVGLRFQHAAGDAGDIDNTAREAALVLGGFLEQGQEGGGHEVKLADIGFVRRGPVLEGSVLRLEQVLLELLARLALWKLFGGCDSRIVDQYAEAFLAGLDLFDQISDLLFARDVRDEGDNLACDAFAVGLDDCLEFFFSAADDVDFGAIDSESLDGHKADTGA